MTLMEIATHRHCNLTGQILLQVSDNNYYFRFGSSDCRLGRIQGGGGLEPLPFRGPPNFRGGGGGGSRTHAL